MDIEGNARLDVASDVLTNLSMSLKAAYKKTRDGRLLRAELMLEELSEVFDAMSLRDEVALADGLADLTYVVVGTATTYVIPLSDVFAEVHASNMSKSSGAADHAGDKGKGVGYLPPNIALAIERGRIQRFES